MTIFINSTSDALKSLLTGKDNTSYDIARVSFLFTNIAFILFVGYDLYMKQKFDMQAFGIAYGAICAGVGTLLKLKEQTEPGGKQV